MVDLTVPEKTREQIVEELRKPIRRMPATVAESLFEDSGFQAILNRYMLNTHIQWAVVLVFTFIGLNNAIDWVTLTYSIPKWATAIVLTPAGGGYMLYQWLKYRRKQDAAPPQLDNARF